jgi:hypothetical protein
LSLDGRNQDGWDGVHGLLLASGGEHRETKRQRGQ